MRYRLIGASLVAALLSPTPLPAQTPVKPAQCVETTVRSVAPYFEHDPKSGIVVEFNTALGVLKDSTPPNAMVVDRNDPPNAIMRTEHKGDHVKLCLIEIPTADSTCDPKTDGRGRVYRVYDERRKAGYTAVNSNHLCGGA